MQTTNSFNGSTSKEIVIIEDVSDKELVKISPLARGGRKLKKLNEIPDKVLDGLNPLVSTIPSLLTSAEAASGKYYRVVVSGDLTKMKGKSGGLRAFTMENGKIKEHAKLFDPSELQNLANFSTAFNVISGLVGQKHLADINKKLEDIKESIDKIKAFQEDERTSEIAYYLSTLQDIASPAFYKHDSTQIKNIINNCDMVLGPKQEHLNSDILKRFKEIEEKGLNEARKEDFSRLIKDWRLCLEARVLSFVILGLSQTEKTWVELRIEKLKEEWLSHQRFLEESFEKLKNPRFVGDSSFLGKVKKFVVPSKAFSDATMASLAHAQWISIESQRTKRSEDVLEQYTDVNPHVLTLEMDNNEIVAIHY
ncbi:MAG: hypothetical protein GX664_02800 [Bacteroidales bacterium]|nr:hypothetical protein [Bacteroidales bacterium]